MNSKLGGLGIYVVHALKGYEFHEKRIENLFNKNGLEWEWVTDGDPSLYTNHTLKDYFIPGIEEHIPTGVISCTLNHIYAYKKMAERGIKYAVVFENDPYFLRPFKKWIQRVITEADKLPPGFIISLENSTLKFPSYWQVKKEQHLYPATAGRAAGAYLVDLTFAQNVLHDLSLNKCHTVIDWWHNALIERGIAKMYWLHPAICEQGSHNGRLNSPLSTNSDNLKRKLSWSLQKWYKMYVKRLFNEKRIIHVANSILQVAVVPAFC